MNARVTGAITTLFAFIVTGCGGGGAMPDAGAECSGRGHLHGMECHCDRGYETPSGDSTACVAVTGSGGGSASLGGGSAGGSSPGGGAGGGGATGPEAVTLRAVMEQGEYGSTHGGGQVWRYGGRSNPFTIALENYSEFGGPATPGSYTLKAADSDYAGCAVCVVIRRGSERYMPVVTAGKTVTFTSLGKQAGERFEGSIDRLEFREVTINATNFMTTEVPNGRRLLVEGFSFSVVLAPPECGGHGHLHGATCHCDPGYRLDPMNPRNCIR